MAARTRCRCWSHPSIQRLGKPLARVALGRCGRSVLPGPAVTPSLLTTRHANDEGVTQYQEAGVGLQLGLPPRGLLWGSGTSLVG